MVTLASICALAGAGLLALPALAQRARQPLARLTAPLQGLLLQPLDGHYRRALRAAGRPEPLAEFWREKALCALAGPTLPLLPWAALSGRLPATALVLALALAGFLVPDLRLRAQARRRRERLFLALPDALSLLALALASGQSLPQALALAARETRGPLGAELAAAATLARRERDLDERAALLRVAEECQEPHLRRFAELLAVKESPYAGFLHGQAAELRAEQRRYLDQAAERAYLAMHLPVAPLLAVLVLLLSFGFLHTLAGSN